MRSRISSGREYDIVVSTRGTRRWLRAVVKDGAGRSQCRSSPLLLNPNFHTVAKAPYADSYMQKGAPENHKFI